MTTYPNCSNVCLICTSDVDLPPHGPPVRHTRWNVVFFGMIPDNDGVENDDDGESDDALTGEDDDAAAAAAAADDDDEDDDDDDEDEDDEDEDEALWDSLAASYLA
jgi:hypothetical protein